MMNRFLVVVLLAGALSLIVACDSDGGSTAGYRLAPVSRGPISSTVSATGTLKAVVTVDVGTQVSGLIKTVEADFNSKVERGQIIARIDPAPFQALLSQSEALLAVAKANVDIQRAALEELEAELAGTQAALTQATGEFKRRKSLLGTNAVSQSAVDSALAERDQASAAVTARGAGLARQRGQIKLAQARVQQARAEVQQRQLDLDYTKIHSPVDGVVISRNVDAGQTVAASLQAPILFRIAEDLRRMEVNISVDEADIGKIREGQTLYFAVDSFLDRVFEGRVHQIRKLGLNLSNVVTYAVVASVDNAEGRLLPGMTANVTIIVSQRDDALQVPQAALRLRLPGRSDDDGKGDWVWVVAADGAGLPRREVVETGIVDGNSVEILDGGLSVGQPVIIGLAPPAGAP
jgi:HlyD family secretion protein